MFFFVSRVRFSTFCMRFRDENLGEVGVSISPVFLLLIFEA